jgi:RHS repeat-associated protein
VWLGDIPVATLRGSSLYYVHSDHLNAPARVTRPSNNALRWRWERAPFGTTAPDENPSGLGTFVYNLRLPGQFYDSETGLNYNYFRNYDPQVGRYVESDPTGLSGGINTYAYVRGNPLSLTDQFGLADCAYDECRQECLRIYNKEIARNLSEFVDESARCKLLLARTGMTTGNCLLGAAAINFSLDRIARKDRDECLEKCEPIDSNPKATK